MVNFQALTLPETKKSHLKMDGWKTIVSFWEGLLAGAMLVSGSVSLCLESWICDASMLGKCSQNLITNGGCSMVMNPMVQSVKQLP